MTRRGNPLVTTSTGLIFFDDQWRPQYNVSFASVDSEAAYWASGRVLVDSHDYVYLQAYTRTYSSMVVVLDGQGVKRDSWPTPVSVPSQPVWCLDASNNVHIGAVTGRVFRSTCSPLPAC